jgi:hypothetical protein
MLRPTSSLPLLTSLTPRQPLIPRISFLQPFRHMASTTQHAPHPSTYTPTFLQPHPPPSPTPISIQATPTEVRLGRLSERNLETAVRAVLQDGLVVVENAIEEHGIIDRLNAKMVEDAKILRDMKDKSPFNYNRGNLQQDAPPVAEWFAPEIFLSKSTRASTAASLDEKESWPSTRPHHGTRTLTHPCHTTYLTRQPATPPST